MAKLSDFESEILKFTLSMYNNFVIPRSEVQMIIENVIKLIEKTYNPQLKREIISLLNKKCDNDTIDDINCIFEFYKNPFSFVDSEHQRFQLYKTYAGYSEPQEFIIGPTIVEEVLGESVIPSTEPVYAMNIPLRHTLEIFLNLPGVLEQILLYMKKLQADEVNLSNYIQGDSWRRRSRFHGAKICLPIHIFEDEIEAGNALGSHAGRNKFGAVYAFIPCLPPHLVSKLSCIFLSTLFYSEDRKVHGNQWVMKKVIDDLNDLKRNGIEVTIDNKQEKIYFDCGLILGDNLGLNGILGFIESFSSGHPCRICRMNISEIKTTTSDDIKFLRNSNNYKDDVAKKNMSVTGIKEECVFHQIDGYDITENPAVDIMHDVLEGSGNYAMTSIVYHLIFVDKVIKYDDLVYRMDTFPYGLLEGGNKPPMIKLKHLQERSLLKMSASEMGCFIRYFGLIVGDITPRDSEVWAFYKKLRQIFDIIMSPRVLRQDSTTLKSLAAEYSELYLKYVGHLTIKSHYLSNHYWLLMLLNGPLIHYWNMRCESKNKSMKLPVVTTFCKKNILLTVATREALQLAYLTLSSNYNNLISYQITVDTDEEKNKYFPNVSLSQIQCLKHIICEGHKYQLDTVIVVDIDPNDGPKFGKIHKIYSVSGEIFFVLNSIQSVAFDDHYHAWITTVNNCPDLIENQKSLPQIVPCMMIKKSGYNYIATRHLI